MKAFGEKVNPELEQTPVPVGVLCLHCDEPIEEGDSGVWLNNDTLPEHIECFMHSIIGSVASQRRQCSCFGGNETEDMPGFSTIRRPSPPTTNTSGSNFAGGSRVSSAARSAAESATTSTTYSTATAATVTNFTMR